MTAREDDLLRKLQSVNFSSNPADYDEAVSDAIALIEELRGEVERLTRLHGHTHDIAVENLSRAVKAEAERDKLREAAIMAREWMSSVEAPLCDTAAFKRDRDTIDRALSLKETAP